MKISSFFYFFNFALKTMVFKQRKPILGTIIVTDKCNLSCKHCAVNNISGIIHPYEKIKEEMVMLYKMGVRILFFCGGETFMWKDGDKNLRTLVIEAKNMGFLDIVVVTNGTFNLDLPEADLILLSMDGGREKHNAIRGDTHDLIMQNIRSASSNNICLYMAINNINIDDIETVTTIARDEKNIRAVSFNLHTPYAGTEILMLPREQKDEAVKTIARLIDEGFPIFNLKSALPYIAANKFPTPCYQCVVVENGNVYTCGRCIEEKGLCDQCGYLFVGEYTLMFNGNLRIAFDMLKTYLKYI
ncbi:MAG TPA: radical SAM protein [Treponemataceae bacterium]|nr:radical SAM protein [Treponemataceae bacterium]